MHLLTGSVLRADDSFLTLQKRLVEVFAENKDAVVRVKAAQQQTDSEGNPKTILTIGTGFFISRDGHIVTNAITVFEAQRVWVEHNQIAYAAELVGLDVVTNMALLRLVNAPRDFPYFHISDSVEMPPVGTLILRISTPMEFDPSPFMGMVSGHETRFAGRIFPCTYIRTTIPAGPGEGGAPILDLQGRFIGVMVAGLPDMQASYFMPARAVLRIRDDLLFAGKVTYGWLGFEVEVERDPDTGVSLRLGEIIKKTPAEAAGLKEGDILLSLGDYPINSVNDLRNAVFYTREGQFVTMSVKRGKETLDLNVKVGARPPEEPLAVPVPKENVDAVDGTKADPPKTNGSKPGDFGAENGVK